MFIQKDAASLTHLSFDQIDQVADVISGLCEDQAAGVLLLHMLQKYLVCLQATDQPVKTSLLERGERKPAVSNHMNLVSLVSIAESERRRQTLLKLERGQPAGSDEVL